jgi:hypothetical protein
MIRRLKSMAKRLWILANVDVRILVKCSLTDLLALETSDMIPPFKPLRKTLKALRESINASGKFKSVLRFLGTWDAARMLCDAAHALVHGLPVPAYACTCSPALALLAPVALAMLWRMLAAYTAVA